MFSTSNIGKAFNHTEPCPCGQKEFPGPRAAQVNPPRPGYHSGRIAPGPVQVVKPNRHFFVVLAVAAALAAGAVIFRALAPVPAPAGLAFHCLDGRTLSLDALRGRPVLVNFWATTCPVCRKEMPDLVALYEDLNAQGLEVIAVAMPYDRPDHVLAFTEREKLPFPVALDIEGRAMHAFGDVKVTPTHVLIDPEGNVVYRHRGSADWGKLRGRIARLLAAS